MSSCLVVQDMIREFGGIQSLVNLLAAGPDAECTHRALLALRILTDKETDRLAILKAGGIAHLVALLAAGPDSEVTEYAAAALGNLAAGSQQIKDAIRQVQFRLELFGVSQLQAAVLPVRIFAHY